MLQPIPYLSGHKSKSRHVLMLSFSRGVFALINKAQNNISSSPCSLASVDLFENAYLFPSRGVGFFTMNANIRAILLSYCYATGQRL